jgi:transcriptional regulator with XRE-family HTH domain
VPKHYCMEQGLGDLGRRVLERRLSLGLSQEDLAERTGGKIDQTGVSRIERGATEEPRILTVAAIARALGCTLDDLITLPAAFASSGKSLDQLRLPEDLRKLIQETLDAARAAQELAETTRARVDALEARLARGASQSA